MSILTKALNPEPDYEVERVTYNPAKPGCVPVRTFGRAKPDGKGGCVVEVSRLVQRKGFRPKVETATLKKQVVPEGVFLAPDLKGGLCLNRLRYL